LFGDARGQQLAKRNVVAAYNFVAALAGHPAGLRITGHSPRVTGAQRLAISGVSEWRIQVFGRWGSSAVLRYIREAVLSGAGETLARDVEFPDQKIDIAALKAQVSTARTSTVAAAAPHDLGHMQVTPADIEDAVESRFCNEGRHVTTDADSSIPPVGFQAITPSTSVLDGVLQELNDLRAEVRLVSSRTFPPAVKCTASGKLHVVRNVSSTFCGWLWASDPGNFSPGDLEATGVWCRRCCRGADRQVGASRP